MHIHQIVQLGKIVRVIGLHIEGLRVDSYNQLMKYFSENDYYPVVKSDDGYYELYKRRTIDTADKETVYFFKPGGELSEVRYIAC